MIPLLNSLYLKKEIKELGGNCWGIIIPHTGSTRVGLYAPSGMTTRMYAWSGMTKDSDIWLVGIMCHVGNDHSDYMLGRGCMLGRE
jgi:hypothetical protein